MWFTWFMTQSCCFMDLSSFMVTLENAVPALVMIMFRSILCWGFQVHDQLLRFEVGFLAKLLKCSDNMLYQVGRDSKVQWFVQIIWGRAPPVTEWPVCRSGVKLSQGIGWVLCPQKTKTTQEGMRFLSSKSRDTTHGTFQRMSHEPTCAGKTYQNCPHMPSMYTSDYVAPNSLNNTASISASNISPLFCRSLKNE